ncbi:BRE1-domain-containing protein [Dendrothele bispora CBS 962.96]|uniref:E3 ubiquitin protein ligase n=1 Tax=Dendrothele bispora (strain CBS 962.96) TaxID=1314807 RepID=A0A4S8MI83_DENBC|nr:BRE1-domain-containing protein [Dendrothele bispora CBS 962.96]
MQQRKRSHSPGEEPATLKKRVLTDENGSPRVNGVAAEQEEVEREPTGDDKLELFRKEAIYRRMKHYSRENERSQSRIAELEERKNTCEAGLAAMSACWMQLVDAIRVFTGPEESAPSTRDIQELYNLSTYVSEDSMPELKTALDNSKNATESLMRKLVKNDTLKKLSREDAIAQCHKAQSESVALKAQVDVLRGRLTDMQELKERYQTELAASENRLERFKSRTVQTIQPKSGGNPNDNQVKDEAEDDERKPSSPAVSGLTNGNALHHSAHEDDWQDIAETRGNRIREQDQEINSLREQVMNLQVQAKVPEPRLVSEHPLYQLLLLRSAALQSTTVEKEQELARTKEELNQAVASFKVLEEAMQGVIASEMNDIKTLLSRREADIARLREHRDQQSAELHERKHKDNVKTASCEEYKALANSRTERILVLQSQLQRCKLLLAANTGRDDILNLLLESPDADTTYVENLHSRLEAAEGKLTVYEKTFSKLQEDHPDVAKHIEAENDALQKLADVSAKLERYQAVYEDLTSMSPDVAKLTVTLQEKEDELHRLRLLDSQRTQSEASLYAELDKLSSAWEALDNQVQNKVFDLSSMEERLQRSSVERAKSENKFYAAMRDKEAVESERKNLTRNLERHAKAVENLKETEKNLLSQLKAKEMESQLREKYLSDQEKHIKNLNEQVLYYRSKLDNLDAKLTEMNKQFQTVNQEFTSQKVSLRTAEEDHIKAKKDLERQTAKLKNKEKLSSSRRSQAEVQSADDGALRLLRCSTCNINFRTTTITRCFHTFCKECIDARLSTRQRKCPACGIGFAQSDVQTLYYQ